MIVVQLILYCLLFTVMVKFAVMGGAVNGLYFYPKPVQERAIEIGLTTRDAIRKKKKAFYDPVLHCDVSRAFADHWALEQGLGFFDGLFTVAAVPRSYELV